MGLKKVNRVIKFNRNAWLKPYIDMDTDLKKITKNDIDKDFLKVMNNAVFEKIIGKCEIMEILNLSQQKEEETIWCQNQIVILQSFSHNIY